MGISSLQLKITDPQRQISNADQVSDRYTDAQKAKIADAAREFESLLTGLMLKSMQQSSKGMFAGEGFGGDYFDTIFENKIASMMSQRNNMGIASVLYKKITGENLEPQTGNTEMQSINSTKSNNSDKKTLPSISPSAKAMDRLEQYDNIINSASNTFGVDKNLIKSVILAESSAKNTAISRANAKGLMQLIDSTASKMGVSNIWNPAENIYGGTKYLAEMIRKYNGNLELALASYNAGPQNVDKYGGIPPFDETKNYVKRVIGYMNHLNGEENGNQRSL